MGAKRHNRGLKMRHKIMIAMIACSLLIATIMGSVSISKSKELLEKYAFEDAQLSVGNDAKELNITIEKIETSVNGLAVTTLELLDDVKAFQTNPAYLSAYQEKVRPIAVKFAEQTEGAMAFYIRFNPTFSPPTSGVFHADSNNDGKIEQLVPTDFSQYDPNDLAHVGWYYIPMKAKKAVWLDPYKNENINVDMISYVVPLIKDGVEIGVVGMDIRFDLFSNAVNEMKTTSQSYGVLLNASQQFLIHPTYKQQDSLVNVNQTLSTYINEKPSGVLSTTMGKEEEIVAFSQLANGHHLLLHSPKAEVYEHVDEMTQLIAMLAVGSILISVLLSIYLSRQLTKPLRLLVSDMKQVQQGDLTIQTKVINQDEIGEMTANFNDMTTQLRDMANSIHEVSHKVRGASTQLAVASQETAATTEEVTTSIEQVAIGSKEQAEFIENGAIITRHLSKAFHELSSTTEAIEASTKQMMSEQKEGMMMLTELVTTNEQNGQATAHIEGVISQLNQKVESIVSILQTIQMIAAQTNLLALNAAIESARAGEAGKGFAVVADEIRSLANQSGEATDRIRHIIQEVQHDTMQTVDAMAGVKETTSEQAQAVSNIQHSINNLSQSIDSIATKMSQHSEAITTLNKDADHLANEIENISSVSEEQAASSSEMSTIMQQQAKEMEKVNMSVEELDELVGELQQLVKVFKL
ncbi:hypothetical protein CD798_14770 [Bacillaceae bacterium SAOS 7]|nr:hypothetical protein CD798_14770 [Bacillaceae bacterium SAOS 7]